MAGDAEAREGGGEPGAGARGGGEAGGEGGVVRADVSPEGVQVAAEALESRGGDAEGDVGQAVLDRREADVVAVDAEELDGVARAGHVAEMGLDAEVGRRRG